MSRSAASRVPGLVVAAYGPALVVEHEGDDLSGAALHLVGVLPLPAEYLCQLGIRVDR